MKKLIGAVILATMPLTGFGAAVGALLEADSDLSDSASLQRGAQLFVNYCLGCHSLQYVRYNRMGRDLGLDDRQVQENLLFAGSKVVDEMKVAMNSEAAKRWFGVAPPDLSVVARARGTDWLYTYLLTFYADDAPARPFGVNNVAFKDVAMPHALLTLQGVQSYMAGEVPGEVQSEHVERLEATSDGVAIHKAVVIGDGRHVRVVDRLVVTEAGEMRPAQYRKAMRDLVNFLTYVGEPAKLVRYRIGFWVLVFIAVFFVLSYALYKEYWKDVH